MVIGATAITWKHHHHTIRRRPVNWGLAALALWLVLTSLLAYDRTAALIGLFNFLPYFVIFAALTELVHTPARLWRLAWLIVTGAIPVVVIGLGQMFWGWGGHIPILTDIIAWPTAPGGAPPGRMSSVFDYTNVLASYLAIPLTLAIGLLLHTYDRGQRQQRSQQGWMQLAGLGLEIAGMLVCMVLTHSRNGWAIAIITLLAFALYRGWYWVMVPVIGAITAVLLAAFGPASPLQNGLRQVIPAYVWARLNDQLFPQPTNLLRTTQWKFALHLTQQRPLTGWGLRNFTPLYEAHTQLWLGHPHNLLLMVSAEAGVPAALLLFGLVGWMLTKATRLLWSWSLSRRNSAASDPVSWRMRRDRLILFSYLIAFLNCTLFHTLDVPLFDGTVNFLGWLLLAGITGLVYRHNPDKTTAPVSEDCSKHL